MDAPFYFGWHRFGARSWHDANWQHVQTLGESLTATREFQEGDPPRAIVRSTATGTADCIAEGELLEHGLDSTQLPYGFPAPCLIDRDLADELWEIVSDYENCQVQKVYAFLIQALYVLDDDAIITAIRDWLGDVPVITIHHHAGPRPGLITIRMADWMIGILDGTWEFQEFAMQAMAFIVGPTDKGSFSTAPLWFDSSTYINNLMNDDGQVPGGRLMMAGHSYGGACALVSCARYKLWDPSRKIVYLTFGSPKIGDQRFVDIVLTCEGLNIIHQFDIVTTLPPDRITLAPLMLTYAGVPLLLYTEWIRPYPQAMIREDGSFDYQSYPLLDTATLRNLINDAVFHLRFDVIEAHKMPRYQSLLQTRCPEVEWPIDKEASFDVHINDQAIAWTHPKGKNSIVWNHPTWMPPPPDGLFCGSAFSLAPNVLHAIHVVFGLRWYVLTVDNSKAWQAEITFPLWYLGGDIYALGLKGPCDGTIVDEDSVAFTGSCTLDWTSAQVIGGKIYIVIQCFLVPGAEITIEVT